MKHVLGRICQPEVVLGAALATAALLRKRPAEATRFLVAVPATLLASKVLKTCVDEHRPRLFDRHPEQSFPSGHSAATTAYLLSIGATLGVPWLFPVAAAAVAVVNVSRVRDREHWPKDVMSGDVLGVLGAIAGAIASRLVRQTSRHSAAGVAGSRSSGPSAVSVGTRS
ncbi:MAG TPA: phosphatase PAP2 family protein [Labilithrix sp.]